MFSPEESHFYRRQPIWEAEIPELGTSMEMGDREGRQELGYAYPGRNHKAVGYASADLGVDDEEEEGVKGNNNS